MESPWWQTCDHTSAQALDPCDLPNPQALVGGGHTFPLRYRENQRWVDKIGSNFFTFNYKAATNSLETRRTTLRKMQVPGFSVHLFDLGEASLTCSRPGYSELFLKGVYLVTHSFIHLLSVYAIGLSDRAWWSVRGIIFLWYYLQFTHLTKKAGNYKIVKSHMVNILSYAVIWSLLQLI